MNDLNDSDIANLRHMLGIGSHIRKKDWGYRNYYCCCNRSELENLEIHDYVRLYRQANGMFFFAATPRGCLAAGLGERKAKSLGFERKKGND